MGEQHGEADPLCMNFHDDIRELMAIYSELDAKQHQKPLSITHLFIE